MTRILFLLVVLGACKDDPHITLDGSTDASPNCKYDCVSELRCNSAVAYQREPQAIPCMEWQGTCPGTALPCTTACDLAFSTNRFADQDWSTRLSTFCVETPPALLGDTCANACLPTRAIGNANGDATQQYLSCDTSADRCVAGTAPDVAGYLGPCAVGTTLATPGVTGVADEHDGRVHACLLAWDAAAMAARQGLTIYCIGDWECPAGSACDDSLTFLQQPSFKAAVCRPGARGAALLGRLPPP